MALNNHNRSYSVSIEKKSTRAVNELEQSLSLSLSGQQKKDIQKIIEKAMIESVHQFCNTSSKVISKCCSADQDMAHKLNDEIKRARQALIANLSSLR